MKKFVTMVVLCMMLIMVSNYENSYAGVKVLSWNLVDNGKHLDWDGKTKYQSHFNYAVKVWNNYKKGVIRKDNIFRWEDVAISDCFEISNVAGVTCSDGTIRFNKYIMDSLPTNAKRNVCIHELGHALGLEHNTRTDIMYMYLTTRVKLSNNDKKSYDYAYKHLYK